MHVKIKTFSLQFPLNLQQIWTKWEVFWDTVYYKHSYLDRLSFICLTAAGNKRTGAGPTLDRQPLWMHVEPQLYLVFVIIYDIFQTQKYHGSTTLRPCTTLTTQRTENAPGLFEQIRSVSRTVGAPASMYAGRMMISAIDNTNTSSWAGFVLIMRLCIKITLYHTFSRLSGLYYSSCCCGAAHEVRTELVNVAPYYEIG